MDRETRELNRLNNETEALLSEEAQRYLTDIVCWLRMKNVEDYQVEMIRNDVTDLLLQAGERGESPLEALGDVETFCRSLLPGVRRKSAGQVAWEYLVSTLYALGIFSGITLVFSTVEKVALAIRSGVPFDWRWDITGGNLAAWLVLTGAVYLLLAWIMATPLAGKPARQSRGRSFLLGAALMGGCLVLAWWSRAFLPGPVLSLPVVPAAGGYALALLVYWLLSRRQEKGK